MNIDLYFVEDVLFHLSRILLEVGATLVLAVLLTGCMAFLLTSRRASTKREGVIKYRNEMLELAGLPAIRSTEERMRSRVDR